MSETTFDKQRRESQELADRSPHAMTGEVTTMGFIPPMPDKNGRKCAHCGWVKWPYDSPCKGDKADD